MDNGKALVIVFRGGNTYWWKPWDGRQHTDTDGFNFKNSLFNCVNQLGKSGDQIGLMIVDKSDDVYNVNSAYRPSDVQVYVISNGIENYEVIDVGSIPESLFWKARLTFGCAEVDFLRQVKFDLSDVKHFLLWSAIKLQNVYTFIGSISQEVDNG